MFIKYSLGRILPVFSLRTHFVVPVLTAAVPLALFATVVVMLLWNQKQHELRLSQVNGARAIAVAIGRDLEFTRAHLEDMANSPLLASDSIDTFRQTAEQVLAIRRDWHHVVLMDRAGDVLLTTGIAANEPLGRKSYGQLPHVRDALTTRQPVLSDFFAAAGGEALVSLVVPVRQYGEVVYLLGAALRFDSLDVVLKSHVERTAVNLVDSRGRLVSRNIDAGKYRGNQVPRELSEALEETAEGSIASTTFEGEAVDAVWTTVPGTSWKVVLSHSRDASAVRLFHQTALLSGLGILLLVASVALSVRKSRRLQNGIESAAEQAALVADGKEVVAKPTGIWELDLLARAHAQAAAKIRGAEKERDEVLAREHQGRESAEQANRAKDEFLAMLGHELRNPIAAISNSAHLLQARALTADQRGMAQSIIVRQTAHLTRIVEDLLDVGRVVSGRIRLRPEPVDLGACVRAGAANVKAAGSGLQHEFELSCTPVMVSADKARLEQIITNLVGNAVKYSPKDSRIVLETCRDGDWAVFRVRDNGIGMGKQQLHSVFELFYQGPQKGHRAGGLGIGLSVVKRIVELHGGSVTAESPGPGRGSTFTVRLPFFGDCAANVAPTVVDARPRSSLNIVVVEDNRDARESLELLLRLDGHAVSAANDGVQGLNQILDVVPDVAIVDLDMPGLDGYEVSRRVRGAGYAGMFLLAHSGYAQAADVERAKEAGFDDHLAKPADMQKLRRLLASATGRARYGCQLIGTAPVITLHRVAGPPASEAPTEA